MSLHRILTIYRKELIETLRDRRTIFVMVVLPVLLYPMVFLGLTALLESHVRTLDEQPSKVAVWGTGRPRAEARAWIERAAAEPPAADPDAASPELALREDLPSPAPAELCRAATDEVRRGTLDAVLVASPESLCGRPASWLSGGASVADARLPEGPLGAFLVLVDATNDRSLKAGRRLQAVLREASRAATRERLRSAGLDPDLVAPYGLVTRNLATDQRMGGHLAGRIIPLLLVMMVVLGAFYPAVDLTAGEKERFTLETLLSSPVRPSEVVLGKYATVVTVSIIAATANLASLALTVERMTTLAPGGLRFAPSAESLAWVLLLMLPTTLFFSALLLAVATLARDFKEAQTLMTPAYVLCVLPATLAVVPGLELGGAAYAAPGLGVTLLVRDVLSGDASLLRVLSVVASTAAYAAAALYAAGRLMASEAIVFGTAPPWRRFLGRQGLRTSLGGGSPRPGPGAVLALWGVQLALLYYVGSTAQQLHLLGGLVVTEWGLLLGVTVLWAWLAGFELRQVFAWRLPTRRAGLGALMVAASAWSAALAASALAETLLPLPQSYIDGMAGLFASSGGAAGALSLGLVLVISPAVCEETLFRGALLAGLGPRLGRWRSILLVGLLFGAFHLSLYRLVPTALLGVVLGFVVWQSDSLFTGMLVHAATNGVVLLAGLFPELAQRTLGVGANAEFRWWALLPFWVLLAAGLWVLAGERPRRFADPASGPAR